MQQERINISELHGIIDKEVNMKNILKKINM
jgi:hypothetical protein